MMGTSTRKRIEIMKRLASTLLTISTILVSSTSIVFANPNESGIVQNSTQNTIITGEDNVSIQTSKQMNRMERRDSTGARSVSVQEVRQNSDVLGNRNISDQYTEQINEINDSSPMNQDLRHDSRGR
jgi:hypothetical protein